MGLKKDFVLAEFGICPEAYLEQCRLLRLFLEGATPPNTQHVRWWKVWRRTSQQGSSPPASANSLQQCWRVSH